MKSVTIISFLVLQCLIYKSSYAQFELTPFGGYAVRDRFDTYYGQAHVEGAALYGIDLGILVHEGAQVELSYERQDSHIFSDNYVFPEYDNENIPVSINYFLVGGLYGRNIGSSPVQPYGGISLGGVLIDGKDKDGVNWGSEFLFDLRGKLGVKVFPNDGRIGLRFQAQLNVPFQGVGSSIGCGTAGCGVSVGTLTTITQLGFSGGLIIKFGASERHSTEMYTN